MIFLSANKHGWMDITHNDAQLQNSNLKFSVRPISYYIRKLISSDENRTLIMDITLVKAYIISRR